MKADLHLVEQGVMLLLVQWKDGTLREYSAMVRLPMLSLRSVITFFFYISLFYWIC